MKRIKLPVTRSSVTSKIGVGMFEMYVTVGFYENRQPGEVFVKVAKNGSTISGLMDGIAVMISMCLQSGWTMTAICNKMRHTRFEPSDDKYESLLDALAANLETITRNGDGDPEKDYEGEKP
jgi:hypothetical protein